MVETNTLSSVPPPDITYTLSIPEPTINNGMLSALQLEAIIYACQVQPLAHNTWNSYSKFELLVFWLCRHLCLCIFVCLQQHEVILQNNQRAGFLIGDGAGVGKGRTVAGIILENYLKGRKKSLWLEKFTTLLDLKLEACHQT